MAALIIISLMILYVVLKVMFPVRWLPRKFWCFFGFHNWYEGSYSSPVWGRFERRCMECSERQYREYGGGKGWWVHYEE